MLIIRVTLRAMGRGNKKRRERGCKKKSMNEVNIAPSTINAIPPEMSALAETIRDSSVIEIYNGPTVAGEIDLTDDAWTASNGDGYLGVSGHWIEEVTSGTWESREALISFVGYLTTDNANNNGTAAVEFAAQLLRNDKIVWHPKERHLP
ncbi:hypothetical protein B0H14DRAFT_2590420 [Mycena olivaceomarginata]|nr:hypothetical protein B0H14DRAFT_2590420 [Mycena olivaceomarginata]